MSPTYSVWLTREVDHEVVVVGSGFSGIAMAIRLQQAGQRDYLVLEKATDLGGTWRDNRYPGCASDVPSHLYSYSFEPNPDWSRVYAPGPEIHDYLRRCADKHGVTDRVWFDSPLQVAEYDEDSGVWTLTIGGPREHPAVVRCRALVLALGPTHEPSFPEVPGLGEFAGDLAHTAMWDPPPPLDGRRVGVLGTGASGVQIVPELASRVSDLTVFQRTPAWVLPRGDQPIGPATRRRFARRPAVARAHRQSLYWRTESRVAGFTSYPAARRAVERLARDHLRDQVGDPGLRASLTPDYALGCKRVVLSDDYYPTLQQDHVALVTSVVDRVEADGVVTSDGTRHRLDTLVLATGFDVTGSYEFVDVFGRHQRNLGHEWRDGAMEAHLGTTVHGFPNLFTLLGPNTALGHTSMVLMIEAQADLVVELLKERDRRQARSVEVLPEVQSDFNAELRQRSRDSVWESGCSSWYLDREGVNRVAWPGSTREFRRQTRQWRPEDYHFAGVRP